MNSSGLFKLNAKDLLKGLVMAILTGAILPVAIAIQTPEFNIATANWNVILEIAMNGAVVGFVSYLTKNFFSDEDGRLGGVIG